MKLHSRKGLYKQISILLMLLVAWIAQLSWAQPHFGQVRIVPSNKLPEAAQRPSVAMFFHYASCDASYLYLEQENGKHLEVIDVTDPSKIEFKSELVLDAPAPFDFVQSLGRYAELIRYRDTSSFAILNLRNPKLPKLQSIGAKDVGILIEPAEIQNSAPLEKPSFQKPVNVQDYLLVDTNRPEKAITIKAVQQRITDEPSGATYLLGQDGLTVLRDPKTEANNLPCSRYSNDYDER